MPFHRIRRAAALILLAVSLVCLAWGVWPAPREQRSLDFSPADLGLPPGPGWRMVVSWPRWLHTGDTVELRLVVTPQTPIPAGEVVRKAVPGGRLAARLEAVGLTALPPGEASQALGQNGVTRFTWQVQARQPGHYPATLWLHWLAQAPAGQRVLSAQRLEWQADDLFGLSGPWARSLGATGIVIGLVFGLDGVMSALWRRAGAKKI